MFTGNEMIFKVIRAFKTKDETKIYIIIADFGVIVLEKAEEEENFYIPEKMGEIQQGFTAEDFAIMNYAEEITNMDLKRQIVDYIILLYAYTQGFSIPFSKFEYLPALELVE